MANVTIPTTITPHATAVVDKRYNAGETVAVGEAVYLKISDGKLWKTDANAAASSVFFGIAMNGALADQPLAAQTGGLVNIGGGAPAQTLLVLSPTAGKTMPAEDLASGDVPSVVGTVLASGLLSLGALRGDGVAA